jgi:hypothetical protein
MGLEMRVTELKNKALRQIEEAAKKGDVVSISFVTRIAEEIERLSDKLGEVEAGVETIEKKLDRKTEESAQKNGMPARVSYAPSIGDENGMLSRRLLGEKRRRDFLHELKMIGVELIRNTESTYRTHKGELVGIATASELSSKPNRWWLGLPPGEYHSVVLLCARENGEVLSFVLPQKFIQEYQPKLSTDHRGNLKFNIAKRNAGFHLLVPHIGSVLVDNFQDNYDALKS